MPSGKTQSRQAKQVASAITGHAPPNPEAPWFWSDQYDLKLQIAGLPFDADSRIVRELQRLHETFSPLVLRAKTLGRSLRIGTNHGSLSDRIMNRYGDTPLGMVESALEFLRIAESHGFKQMILSMKASNPKVMIQAYRLLVARMNEEDMHYPLLLTITIGFVGLGIGHGRSGRGKNRRGHRREQNAFHGVCPGSGATGQPGDLVAVRAQARADGGTAIGTPPSGKGSDREGIGAGTGNRTRATITSCPHPASLGELRGQFQPWPEASRQLRMRGAPRSPRSPCAGRLAEGLGEDGGHGVPRAQPARVVAEPGRRTKRPHGDKEHPQGDDKRRSGEAGGGHGLRGDSRPAVEPAQRHEGQRQHGG
eukprot:gene3240-4415_t